jgi:hypothetical protein
LGAGWWRGCRRCQSVGVQARLVDCQGAVVQGPGVVEVTLLLEDEGEVVEALGGVGVVGTHARPGAFV